MDIVPVPITVFFKNCLSGAKKRGFIWIICLLARENDVDNLYYNLKRSWNSLDSITGDYFLFLFAGKENLTKKECADSGIEDIEYCWCKRYNNYVRILNKNNSGKPIIRSRIYYDSRNDSDNNLSQIEKTQTDAINSLRKHFNLKESNIPSIVFTSLHTDRNYCVPINPYNNDIYSFFKELFNIISPYLDELDEIKKRNSILIDQRKTDQTRISSMLKDKNDIIVSLFTDLEKTAKENGDLQLMDCLLNRRYYTTTQPTRGKLSKYIDLTKAYEKKNNIIIKIEELKKELFIKKNEKEHLEKRLVSIDGEIEQLNKRYDEIIFTIERIIEKNSNMYLINAD